MPVAVLDSHTHLDIVGGDPAEQIAAATAVGVDRLVQVGVDVASSRWSAALAAEHDAVLAAVAIHPNEAPRLSELDEALREIEALAAQPRVRGVGETGLDFFRTGEMWPRGPGGELPGPHRDRQAVRQGAGHPRPGRPRGRAAGARRRGSARSTVVMHCFSGDAEFADAVSCAAASS